MSKLLIGILVTWRLTSLFNRELGPGEILRKVRYKIGVRWDKYSQPYGITEAAKGLLCFWCCSVWMGAIVAIFGVLLNWFPLLSILAI